MRLLEIKAWKLMLCVIVLSELFTLMVNVTVSYARWGRLNIDLLLISSMGAFIVSFIVGGSLVYFLGLVRKNEKTLRDSEARLRNLFDSATDGIFILDLEGNFIDLNTTAHTRLGHTKDEMLSMHIGQLVTPEFSERVSERLSEIREEGVAVFESAHVRKDGTAMPVEVNGRLLDHEGRKVYFSTIRDITERREVDAALRERERQLAESQRIAHIGSWQHNLTTNEVVWSDELFRVLGLDPEKDPGDFNMFFDMIHPDDQPVLKDAIAETLETGKHFSLEYRFRMRDGRTRLLHAQAELISDETGTQKILSGTAQDITDWKEAENRIRESEDRFRTIFEQAKDGICIADIETKEQIEANMAICDMLGYSREELLELYVDDLHPKESLPYIRDVFEKQVRGEITLAPELPMLRKDGTIFYVEVNSARITLNGRNCLVGFFRDITERMEVDAALRERERQLAESQRIAHIGSWQHNLTTNEAIWSDELFRVLGLDPGKDVADFNMFFDMIHPDDQPVLKKAIAETLETGKHYSVEYRFRMRDGRTRLLHAQAELISDETGTQKILSGTAQDITDWKEAENKIREALKEKEVLLKEIHHRVKNNMAIISSLLQLQTRYIKDEELNRIFRDSQNRIRSMALVHEKLYSTQDLANISFNDYIDELARHLFGTYKKEVALKLHSDDICLNIDLMIPCGLIINELITNSLKHAFNGMERPEIDISMIMDGRKMRLAYADNGVGLPGEIDLRKANTLGLQIVSMLAYQLKGSVDIERTDGTKFVISLGVPVHR